MKIFNIQKQIKMKNIKQKLKKIFLTWFFVSLFFLVWINITFWAKDLMEQAFEKSAEQEQIVDIGNGKNAVWNSVFEESMGASWKGWDWFKVDRKEWLLMHFIRLAMKIAIIIAVPMIIINAIMLIVSTTSWTLTKALKYISYITLGIVIILSSIAVIYLILSATSSTVVPEMQNLK